MSTAPKGYSSSQKLDRVPAEYACVGPVSNNQNALTVVSKANVYVVGTDTAEAGSTESVIVATGIGSVAARGDIIRFTSGAFSGFEASVLSVATNSVTLAEDLSSAIANGVTFQLLRYTSPTSTSSGAALVSISSSTHYMANTPIRNAYGTTPVTTAAYVEMVASLTATSGKIQIFDSSGETLIFAVGAAGAENPIFYIPPGGIDIELTVAAGSRIAIKALSANATDGEFVMNITT